MSPEARIVLENDDLFYRWSVNGIYSTVNEL